MRIGKRSARAAAIATTVAVCTVGSVEAQASDGAKPPRLEFLGQAIIPTGTTFQGTIIGGLSSITFDPARGVFYSLSDDQGQLNPVRFYTLAVDLSDGRLDDGDVEAVGVTTLLAPDGQPYAPTSLDPEGLTLTKSGELVVTSEGIAARGISPWVRRYALDGTFLGDLPVPDAFQPTSATHGVRQNLAFEAAAVAPNGRHLFVGMEGALVQDGPAATLGGGSPARILRYNLAARRLDRQYVYVTDPDRRAVRAAHGVRRQRARRAAPVQQRVHAVDGALLLGRRARNGEHDQALRARLPGGERRERPRQHRGRARRRPTRGRRSSSSTSPRSGFRSTTSRGCPSVPTCRTADGRSSWSATTTSPRLSSRSSCCSPSTERPGVLGSVHDVDGRRRAPDESEA